LANVTEICVNFSVELPNFPLDIANTVLSCLSTKSNAD